MKTINQYFETSKRRAAAMTIVVRGDRVLILQRSHHERWMPGFWNLPGGGVKDGETPGRAAARECMEESGIKPLHLSLWQRIEKPFIDLYVYRSECDEDDEVLLDPFESTDYAWVSLERLDSFQFVPDCKEWIKINLLKSPPIGVMNKF